MNKNQIIVTVPGHVTLSQNRNKKINPESKYLENTRINLTRLTLILLDYWKSLLMNNNLISSKNKARKNWAKLDSFWLTLFLWHCRSLDGCYGCRVDRVSMLSVCPDTELDIRIQWYSHVPNLSPPAIQHHQPEKRKCPSLIFLAAK